MSRKPAGFGPETSSARKLFAPRINHENLQIPPSTTLPDLYLFFHSRPRWEDKSMRALCLPNEEASTDLTSSMPPFNTLTINVSNPSLLLNWLQYNPASRITTLFIFVNPNMATELDDVPNWSRLFAVLARDATRIQHLTVFWDAEGWLFPGLGKNVEFIRALVKLRVKNTIEIEGSYAMHWPRYIERNMGLAPGQKQLTSDVWKKPLREFQKGTEGIIP